MNNDLLDQLATQIADIKSQAIDIANDMPSLTYAEFDTAINALIGEAWTAEQLIKQLQQPQINAQGAKNA
ncbi:hypothetical protein EOL70_18455 [Leucothrix sargassi]|nr:hypothetical protein EOL70_18455 [Leucothrix sargassi]